MCLYYALSRTILENRIHVPLLPFWQERARVAVSSAVAISGFWALTSGVCFFSRSVDPIVPWDELHALARIGHVPLQYRRLLIDGCLRPLPGPSKSGGQVGDTAVFHHLSGRTERSCYYTSWFHWVTACNSSAANGLYVLHCVRRHAGKAEIYVRYPMPIPNSTVVPEWAFQPVAVSTAFTKFLGIGLSHPRYA